MSDNPFKTAFLWHMAQAKKEGITLGDVAEQAGVSLDILKRLNSPNSPHYRTNSEAANKIADYFGKDYDSFVSKRAPVSLGKHLRLFARLNPRDRRVVMGTMEGMIESYDLPAEDEEADDAPSEDQTAEGS